MAVAKENKIVRGNDLTYIGQQIKANFVAKDGSKVLSTNDYTTAEKNKLAGIAAGAEVNVNADWNAASGDAQILNKPSIPTKTSDLANDSGFITSSDIPEGAAASSTVPLEDGTAAVGTELAFARGDHRHPHDTSKANVNNPQFTGQVGISDASDGGSLSIVYGEGEEYVLMGFDQGNDPYPFCSTSRGSISFKAPSNSVAELTKSGTIAMTSDITTAISGKADSATTLAGYGITNAYTKTEVDTAISNALKGGYVVVATLPTASADTLGKIYLVPMTDTEASNVKEEYVTWLDGSTYKWEKLGTTQFDNSDYEERLTAAEITTLLNL